MPWIKTVPFEDAKGLLKKLYDESLKRAGRIHGVVQLLSLNPGVMRSSLQMYGGMMKGKSLLSRGQREMLAIVVSRANQCVY